jgi:mono/diheme cytochrome c family protein
LPGAVLKEFHTFSGELHAVFRTGQHPGAPTSDHLTARIKTHQERSDVSLPGKPTASRIAIVLATAAALVLPSHHRAKAADSQLNRGRYLVHGIVACGNCHTPKGPDGQAIVDQELAGGVEFNAPIFHAVAPNITPDKETGIGNWTDDQIVSAIRNGKRPDGTTIGPPMPFAFYRDMSDTDIRAIVTYLRSVKPINNKVEKSTWKLPLPNDYGPMVTQVADVPPSDKATYGHYLAIALGHCMDCHTPKVNGAPDLSRIGAGGRKIEAWTGGLVTSANLTPANPSGIAGWTDAQVKTAITDGVRPDGRRLVLLMAFDGYKNMDNQDLDALVAYLRTLKPSKAESGQ